MNTLTNTLNNAVNLTGVYNFDTRNVSTPRSITAPVYYIDEAILDGQNIDVDYMLNDDWCRTTVDYLALKAFVVTTGLNDYCFDSSDCDGNHVQDSGSFNSDTYIAENFSVCVRDYLAAYKVGQNVN
jgi:hypothetical protein